MIIRQVSKEALSKEPYLVWNSFIDLVAMEEYEVLDDVQKVAHLCFRYDAEVQNGGHLQYFENKKGRLLEETLQALDVLGAPDQRKILEGAIQVFRGKPRKEIATVEEYVETALMEEYEVFDSAYYACDPSVIKLLEDYLQKYQTYFVQII